MRERRFAAIGLLVVGLALPLAFVLEVATRPEGTDGDNATDGLRYLQDHATAYRLSGLCLVLAALGLIRAATAVPWRSPFLTAVGSVAAGLWTLAGALRLSSPGPIAHISGYDEDWGESAYLTVQMAGTQGALLGGVVVAEIWVVTGSLVAWTRRDVPRALCALGLVALLYPLGTALSLVTGDTAGALWVLGIASLVLGVPAWFLATGSFLALRSSAPRLTSSTAPA
jgi:hypothetical protein